MRIIACASLCAALAIMMLLPAAPAIIGEKSAPRPPAIIVWRDVVFRPGILDTAYDIVPQTRGVSRLLMLAIEFTNVKHDLVHNTSFLDGLGDGPNSLNTYYYNASFGRMNVSSACWGWYNSSRTMQYFGTPSGNNQDSQYLDGLITEAVNAANAEVDFSQYDQNSDGWVDNLLIVHAGDDQATSGNANDIWSEMGYDTDQPVVDGKRVGYYTLVSESSPMGVVAHEFGHLLGMPDLYDTDYTGSGGQTDGAGLWDIMASGNYLNSGDTPSLPSAWSRVLLGWANLVTVSANIDSIVLVCAAQCSTVLKINIPDHPREYFLIENREKVGYDAYLPGQGLLMWHIDESKGTIQYNDLEVMPGRKRVTLEEAHGGRQDLDSADYNMGDSRDPWYSSAVGFTPTSDPNSSAASDGHFSFISVKNIGPHGPSMSFGIRLDTPLYDLGMTPSTSLVKADPGASSTYTVSLYNQGSVNDFNITVDGSYAEWSRPMPSTIRLGYLESGMVTVTVQPPAGTPANLTALNAITATPASDQFRSFTAAVTVKVNPKYRGVFGPSRDVVLFSGERLAVTLLVYNLGNLQDTITMSLTGAGTAWINYTGPTRFTLSAGANTSIYFNASIPWGTLENARSFVVVGGRSQDGSTCTAATINFTANPSSLLEIQPPVELDVKPGVPCSFNVLLVNAGTSDVAAALGAMADAGWFANFSQSLVLMPAWSSHEVQVLLTPAPDAPAGLLTAVNLTASYAGTSANVSIPVNVEQVFGASIAEGGTSAEIVPGVAYEYRLMVLNSGNGQDELTFGLVEGEGGEGWQASLDAQAARLKAKESAEVVVTVTSPEKALAGAEWRLNLTVGHSDGQSSVFEIISKVTRIQKISVGVNPPSRTGSPGDLVVFNFTVSNNGNWPELVMLSLRKQDGLTFDLERDSITLDPGASGTVRLNCRLVTGAMAGLRAFNITASSNDNASVNSSAQLKVTVNSIWGADISMKEDTKAADAGGSVTFQLTLANRGNAPDTYSLSKSAGTMGVAFERASLSLGPGESGTVNLTVSVSADEMGGSRSVKISIRSQGKPGEVAQKEINVDVRAKAAVTPAMIAIPLVVVIAVIVAGAIAGVLHVRSRKRVPGAGNRVPGTGYRVAGPSSTAGQKPPTPAPKSEAPARKPQIAPPKSETPATNPEPPRARPEEPKATADNIKPEPIEEVIEVTVVEEPAPHSK
jgi:immune inhibitor A